MGTIIKRHNAPVCRAEHQSNDQSRRCNCRNPDHSPLNEECLVSSIVYEATVHTGNALGLKTYIGSTETPLNNGSRTAYRASDMRDMRTAQNYRSMSGSSRARVKPSVLVGVY